MNALIKIILSFGSALLYTAFLGFGSALFYTAFLLATIGGIQKSDNLSLKVGRFYVALELRAEVLRGRDGVRDVHHANIFPRGYASRECKKSITDVADCARRM